jgi:hypothetical protein
MRIEEYKDYLEYRCPGCNFLVTGKDVASYGYVCPDCKTNWHIHPLRNDDGKEVEGEAIGEDARSKRNKPRSSEKRLVR